MDNATVITEAKRIEEDSLFSAKAHFEDADGWTRWHFWIGIPATILAAFATGSALGNYLLATAWMAAASAVLTALLTFLDPKARAAVHLKAGNAYKALANNARIFREIRSPLLDAAGGAAELRALNDMRNALNADSAQPSQRAYRRAKKMIEGGQTAYAVDKKAKR